MVKAESSKDGAAAQVTPQITLSASFATLADALIVASQACRTFANVSGHDQDPAALAAVIAGIKASGISLGGLGATPGRKGPAPKTAEQEARADKKRKRAEKKAAKDPNAPKRPASAYLMYQNEVREHYKDLHPKVAYQEVLKLIGDSWKTLAEDQKKVYLDRASDSMDEYKKEAEGYKQDPTAAGIQAAMAATNDDDEDEDEDEDDEIEEAEEEIPKSPESASSSDEDESSSDEEAPAPVPVKKSKKNATPAAVPTPPAKVAKAAPKAVESAKKAKKEKKKASA